MKIQEEKKAQTQNQTEDFREFYITPLYIENMKRRAKKWNENFIQQQLDSFRKTIPDYPELHHLLETELHTRQLNKIYQKIRSVSKKELKTLLSIYKKEADYCEMIQTELEIRSGVKSLKETTISKSSQKTHVRIM